MDAAKKNKINVIFLESDHAQITPIPRTVFLHPTGKHDDFGLKSIFEFHYFQGGDAPILMGSLKLGFVGAKESSHSFIRKFLAKADDSPKSASPVPNFFTMQFDIQHYRKIVKELGVDGAKDFLIAIQDLVALRKFKVSAPSLDDFLKSETFSNSLTRESDAFFAFLNAGSILDGIEYEQFDRISESLLISIDPQTAPIGVNFNLKNILPNRLVAFIGKNGAGKSQTLRTLVESLMAGDGRVQALGDERPTFNRVLAIATPGETDKTFPIPRRRSRINYKRITTRRSARRDGYDGLAGLIVQLMRSKESIGKKTRLDLFFEAISKILPLDKIALHIYEDAENPDSNVISSIDRSLLPIHRIGAVSHRSGRPVVSFPMSDLVNARESVQLDFSRRILSEEDPIFTDGTKSHPLSSGQVTFMRLAAQVCLHIENGSLLLMDEPETHLHPKLVSDLVGLLTTVLDQTGSACILATHSAYFIREIPRSQVLIFSRDETGAMNISVPRARTLGADIGEISFSIFGEQDFGFLIEKLKRELFKTQHSETAANQIKGILDELPTPAKMFLENEVGIDLSELQ